MQSETQRETVAAAQHTLCHRLEADQKNRDSWSLQPNRVHNTIQSVTPPFVFSSYSQSPNLAIIQFIKNAVIIMIQMRDQYVRKRIISESDTSFIGNESKPHK